MKPTLLIETVPAAGSGEALQLFQHDKDFSIRIGKTELMNSRMHGSEEALARLACDVICGVIHPHVLIGGLGMGFTLRAALESLPAQARLSVAELIPAVIRWNHGVLGSLAGHPLKDSRVNLCEDDVAVLIKKARGFYHAILLDVDNGPNSLFADTNKRLYSLQGLFLAYGALKRGGVLAVWSASPDDAFSGRLAKAGFEVEVLRVNARSGPKAGGHHWIWLARK